MLFKLIWLVAIAAVSTEARVFECQRMYYGGNSESAVETDGLRIWNFTIEIKYDTDQVDVRESEKNGMNNVFVNGTEVHFKGHVAPSYENSGRSNMYFGPLIFQTGIDGTGRVLEKMVHSHNYKSLSDCELNLRIPITGHEKVPGIVMQAIMSLATTCINAKPLCDNLYSTKPENSEVMSRSVAPRKMITQDEMLSTNNIDYNSGYMVRLQSTINILVDLAIAEIVKKIREESNGVIQIPDIRERFSEGHSWTLRGEFDATNGSFSDLTTLSRDGDANLSHDGLKFIATCGFGLAKAHINYEKYKLKYGISVSGRLSVDVDGLAISISTAVDYSHKPCRVVLQGLRVTEMGKLHVHLTGLRPLNNMVSRLVTAITNKWEGDIVNIIVNRIRGTVQEHLDSFDCEKFRP